VNLITIIQLTLFIGMSIILFLFSRPYLSDPRKHGFYRFFGWEASLLLVVFNMRVWFDDPFSPRQTASWLLLFLSVLLAAVGFLQLTYRGKPDGFFENTTELVENGLYRFIRHPLYSSLILGTWGVALKNPDMLSMITGVAATICYFFTAKVEEEEMIVKFGDIYRGYIRRSKMFIPLIF
jgi:protein-S-isoprenylcysteine O-methyltransferase Ste14